MLPILKSEKVCRDRLWFAVFLLPHQTHPFFPLFRSHSVRLALSIRLRRRHLDWLVAIEPWRGAKGRAPEIHLADVNAHDLGIIDIVDANVSRAVAEQ